MTMLTCILFRYSVCTVGYAGVGHHWMHPALIASIWQEEGWWKGMPAKSDIRVVLTKVLQKGIRWVFLRKSE